MMSVVHYSVSSVIILMCLATDVCLTADAGVVSLIPAWSHTLMEIDHEIISMVVIPPSTESYKKVCCQLQIEVCAHSTGYPFVQACTGKSVVRELAVPPSP